MKVMERSPVSISGFFGRFPTAVGVGPGFPLQCLPQMAGGDFRCNP